MQGRTTALDITQSNRFKIMKKLANLILAASFLLFYSPGETNAESAETIRIVSWNIEWYPGKRRSPDEAQIQAHTAVVKSELKKINPDVFLAQEMADWQSFAELTDAVPGLRPAVLSAFVSEDTGEYWRQQLGIASKLPVEAAWSEPWAVGDPTPRRGFSAAVIRLPGKDRLLLVYCLHLKSNRSNSDEETQLNFRTREESTRQLLAHIKKVEETVFPGRIAGVVIGGDFNTNQDGQFEDKTLDMLLESGFHQAWEGVPREARLTWRGSSRFEPTTFDHFFTKGLGKPKARLLEVADETSDHWPLEIEVQIPGAE
jgi:endonuclease/exonuclease/phosphatase family metal-dependent hydrolase